MKRIICAAICSLSLVGLAQASDYNYEYGKVRTYSVSITNITKGVILTPFLAATHRRSIAFFELGQPASTEMAAIAEGGDVGPLNMLLLSQPNQVYATANSGGLLMPGQTLTLDIEAAHGFNYLSLAAMLLPTNDSFAALNRIRLPARGTKRHLLRAYDAGSELNDELCVSIPGPMCGGEGGSPGSDGEGYVYISPGIHGEGDLAASAYDWRDVVVQVTVTRTH